MLLLLPSKLNIGSLLLMCVSVKCVTLRTAGNKKQGFIIVKGKLIRGNIIRGINKVVTCFQEFTFTVL